MLYHRLALALFAAVALANPLPDNTDICSTIKCKSGTECAVVDGKAQCVPSEGQQCGSATCGAGQYCCSESCSICAPIGGACTQQFCQRDEPEPEPEGEQCGSATCSGDQFCCNSSCSICAPIGGMCTQQVCQPEPEAEGEKCGPNVCAGDMKCCNPTCGYCVAPGESCTEEDCGLEGGGKA